MCTKTYFGHSIAVTNKILVKLLVLILTKQIKKFVVTFFGFCCCCCCFALKMFEYRNKLVVEFFTCKNKEMVKFVDFVAKRA